MVVVGDSLLDVDLAGRSDRDCPDAPGAPVVDVAASRARPGGAALAAVQAARLAPDGCPVVLLTALGDDAAAERLRGLLGDRVTVHALPLAGATPVKTRVLDRGRPVARLDTGDGRATADGPAAEVLTAARAVLVADYGRGVAALPGVRELLAGRPAGVPLVWDPHPRGSAPVAGTDLVTPNASEARRGAGGAGPVRAARRLRRRWDAGAVAVTRGRDGAVLAAGGARRVRRIPVPGAARPARGGRADSCGAGDVFSAAAAASLAGGATAAAAVAAAVEAASRFVAAGGAGGDDVTVGAGRDGVTVGAGRDGVTLGAGTDRVPAGAGGDGLTAGAGGCGGAVADGGAVPAGDSGALPDAAPAGPDGFALAERVRRAGGRVAATGGCFDLLHPGHVRVLQAARARGDALVVCLNSDDSVARLKGPGRPYATAADRAAVLLALSCVDAVVTFDGPDPSAVLDRLRPDVWVKGGDHDPDRMPETRVVRAHGGTVETVPRVGGHSTSRLAAAARAAASPTTDTEGTS
nr:PfkB family carbohydrate kinase [Pseudonocardia sp. C8]